MNFCDDSAKRIFWSKSDPNKYQTFSVDTNFNNNLIRLHMVRDIWCVDMAFNLSEYKSKLLSLCHWLQYKKRVAFVQHWCCDLYIDTGMMPNTLYVCYALSDFTYVWLSFIYRHIVMFTCWVDLILDSYSSKLKLATRGWSTVTHRSLSTNWLSHFMLQLRRLDHGVFSLYRVSQPGWG